MRRLLDNNALRSNPLSHGTTHRMTQPHRRRPVSAALLASLVFLLALWPLAGCRNKTREAPPAVAPAPATTGPTWLRGTVGSMAFLRPGSDRPLVVENYGIVVFPPGTGTGSSEVPQAIRQRLINDLRKKGIGSPQMRAKAPDYLKPFFSLTPAQFLDSHDTAVVKVRGLIPPGATAGTRFDLVVQAHEQTQTTNLASGTLWTTELGVMGLDTRINYTRPLANGYGAMYIDPTDDETPADRRLEFRRTGVVVGGGTVREARRIELLLNQPSWQRSRTIANRINERFGLNQDRIPIAQPQTDVVIRLNIPPRWAGKTDTLLELISHLWVQGGEGFEAAKARDLGRILVEQPEAAERVTWAWKSLGRTAIGALREYYTAEYPLHVRLASLEAGAFLNDERAAQYLDGLSASEDPAIRKRVAESLALLPGSIQGTITLKKLLDDADDSVRFTAYESLAAINDHEILRRVPVLYGREVKFVIDHVPSSRPLIYITQRGTPRIALFGDDMAFRTPMIARLWDNRLMLKNPGPDHPLTAFYQRPGAIDGKTYNASPTIATLCYLLAHAPYDDDPQDGMGLSFGEVADVLYQLVKDGHIDANIHVVKSELAERVEAMQQLPQERPEGMPGELGVPIEETPAEEGTPDLPQEVVPAGEIDGGLSQRSERPDTP